MRGTHQPQRLLQRLSLSSHHQHQRRQTTTTTTTTSTPSFTHLQTTLPTRHLPIIYDNLSPTPSHLLSISLSSLLPHTSTSPIALATATNPSQPPTTTSTLTQTPLPPSHHLIYFPPVTPGPLLLPDGTDPLQSPGEPFVRRMWAGGAVRFRATARTTIGLGAGTGVVLPLDCERVACVERIADVAVKGQPGQEKVFVGIERRIGRVSDSEDESAIRVRFLGGAGTGTGTNGNGTVVADDDFAGCELIERRNIVFMRERTKEQAIKDMEMARTRQLRPPDGERAFEHRVRPDTRLLFRYSALTYNAHAIHLDPGYCRDVEGHRGLLVHGPLSFTLLLTMLRIALRQRAKRHGGGLMGQREEVVRSVEYRALSPLYVDEEIRLCGVEKGEGKWDIWAETPDGGVAVSARVKTEVGELVQYPDLEMMGW